LRANGRVIGIGASSTIDRSISKSLSLIGSVISMSTLSGIDLMLKSRAFHGVNMKELGDHNPKLLRRDLEELMKLFAAKVIRPEMIKEYPWTEIAKAHHELENRSTVGKIVIIPTRVESVSSPSESTTIKLEQSTIEQTEIKESKQEETSNTATNTGPTPKSDKHEPVTYGDL